MFDPPLSLLRETVHPAIGAASARLIKHSSTPAAVYRIFFEYAPEPVDAEPIEGRTLIAKRVYAGWPDDPSGHLREARFYTWIAPRLAIPQPRIYYAGAEHGTENQLILMQDIEATHYFPPPNHCWTMEEIRPILRAYARFHESGASLLPAPAERGWLLPRHEKRLFAAAEELPAMVEELSARGIWPRLPTFPRLLDNVLEAAALFEQEPAALIHNDVFPPNAALPREGQGEVLLFDWEMLSWGLPEMDLAFMFLQPFGSHRGLDRRQVLDWYWEERETSLSPQGRRARQRYADSLWALWLIPVAHRVVRRPFPAGSFPRRYWEAMLPVLAARLTELTGE